MYYFISIALQQKSSNVLIISLQYTYEKLLQQEGEGQTNIKFVLISFCKDEQHFSDLSSLLKALPLDRSMCEITFIKEEGTLFTSLIYQLIPFICAYDTFLHPPVNIQTVVQEAG